MSYLINTPSTEAGGIADWPVARRAKTTLCHRFLPAAVGYNEAAILSHRHSSKFPHTYPTT
jgi:hypothetical protein